MLRRVMVQFKKTIAFYIINGVLQVLAASMSVVYFQKLLDRISLAQSFEAIFMVFLTYGILMIMSCISSYIDEHPMRILSNGIYHKLKLLALEKIAKIDYVSYQDIGTGRLVQLIENGASAGKKMLFDFYIYIFRDLVPSIVISLIIIGIYNTEIMIVIAVGYIFILIITNLLLKYLYKIKNRLLTYEENLSKYSVRGFMELVVFRINKRYKKEISKISDISNHIVKSQAKIRMIHELFFALFELIVITIKLVIIFTGINQVVSGRATIGTIVALIAFTDRIYTPIAIFNVKYVDFKLDKVAYNRFCDFMNLPDDINLQKGQNIVVNKGSINYSNVSFHYENTEILRNLSFNIRGGSSAAIVGTSGAGKSTIVKIILGLLKPTGGQVLIDSTNLINVKLECYYDYISYVSQDPPIFDGTLRENIVFDNQIDDSEILNILDLVLLKDFVAKLPDGLDTQVGEKGLKLSGGEKQRLAFARVFFQKSKIVILDEPTSALDSITEDVVTNNMLKVLRNRTILIIAHRLQTIKNVDNILVIDNGNVVEQGNFKELLLKQGLFNDLWERQMKVIDK